MASAPSETSQAPSLIDPRTRFEDLDLQLPPPSHPVLQRDFPASKPDCGERSYKGHGRLRGRHALVTGGDSGMGRAVAIAMAREGAKVAINYLPAEEPDAQDVAKVLAKDGIKIKLLPGDLLDEDFCAKLISDAEKALGGLDILVNNAGFAGVANDDITTYTTERWDKTFKTNVYTGFWLTRAAAKCMPAGSAIVWTVSDIINNPTNGVIDYAASKGAVGMMVQTLALSLASKGIRVNGVAPGLIYTPLLAEGGLTTEILQLAASVLPFRRPGQPVELAPIYVDLAEGNHSYTSGSIVQTTGAATGYTLAAPQE